jgi:hypothetical protein
VLPGTKQLLTASGGNPNIGVANRAVRDERTSEAAGEAERENDGVRARVGEPDAAAKFLHVRGHSREEVGTGFSGHRAGSRGRSGPVGTTKNYFISG